MKITAFILAILSLVLCWVPVIGFALGLTAFILSIIVMNKKDGEGKGLTIASIIMSTINLVFGTLMFIGFLVSLLTAITGDLDYSYKSKDTNRSRYNSSYNSPYNYYDIYRDSIKEQNKQHRNTQKMYEQYSNALDSLNKLEKDWDI